MKAAVLAILSLGPVLCRPAMAQQGNTASPDAQAVPDASAKKPLEMEFITIRQHEVEPEKLIRPSGKFILVLVNATDDPKATFSLKPAPAAGAAATATAIPALLTFQGLQPVSGHKFARFLPQVFDATSGDYQIIFNTTGVAICTVTIQ